MPVPAMPIDVPAGSGVLIAGRAILMGFALGESTGAAAAKVRLHDGGGITGTRVVPVTLGANESVRDWFGTAGVIVMQGVFFELVAGAVEGVVFVIAEAFLPQGGFQKLVYGAAEGVEHVG